MTRVNASIPVYRLTDQHLLAEHREIKRIPSVKYEPNKIPPRFKLGTGHVKFFTDKHKYLRDRYLMIYNECIRRGFNVTSYIDNFVKGTPQYNPWTPSHDDEVVVRDRIIDRINNSKCLYRYYGRIISRDEAINLLTLKP